MLRPQPPKGVCCLITGTSRKRPQAPVAERSLRSRLPEGERVFKSHNSSDYRREAATCGTFADSARSPGDRELLRRMQRSRVALAENQERLDRLPPLPPVNTSALTVVPAAHC
jgi:hypothetical protein